MATPATSLWRSSSSSISRKGENDQKEGGYKAKTITNGKKLLASSQPRAAARYEPRSKGAQKGGK